MSESEKEKSPIASTSQEIEGRISGLARLCTTQFSALRRNLESVALYDRRVNVDRLARERLERQFQDEAGRADVLSRQLELDDQKYKGLVEELNKIKSAAEDEITALMQESLKFKERSEARERELLAVIENLKSEGSAQAQKINKLSEDNARMIDAVGKLEDQVRLLEEHLSSKRIEAAPASEYGPLFEVKKTVEPEGLFRRWINWWLEPVALIGEDPEE